eukprot:581540-Prorocentrum_minimum.AAC.3
MAVCAHGAGCNKRGCVQVCAGIKGCADDECGCVQECAGNGHGAAGVGECRCGVQVRAHRDTGDHPSQKSRCCTSVIICTWTTNPPC